MWKRPQPQQPLTSVRAYLIDTELSGVETAISAFGQIYRQMQAYGGLRRPSELSRGCCAILGPWWGRDIERGRPAVCSCALHNLNSAYSSLRHKSIDHNLLNKRDHNPSWQPQQPSSSPPTRLTRPSSQTTLVCSFPKMAYAKPHALNADNITDTPQTSSPRRSGPRS